MKSFVADVNGNRLHTDRGVIGFEITASEAAAVAPQYLTAEHTSKRDPELLAEPAVDDEIYRRLQSQEQHGK